LADARGIKPMGFGQMTLCPIPLGSTARASFNGQPCRLQLLIERPASRVHRRRVLQGPLCLGLEFRVAKLCRVSGPLALIARLTGEGEMRGAVATSSGSRRRVFNLERHVVALQ
jgi:hypothetical protein